MADKDRVTISIKKNLYEIVARLSEESGKNRTQIADAIFEYGLKRATVKKTVELIFTDPGEAEPYIVFPTNGSVAESSSEPDDGERLINERFPHSQLLGREIRERLHELLENGPLSSIELRTQYRNKYREDPGNINAYMEVSVDQGVVNKDTRQAPYVFSLATTSSP